MIPQFCYGPVPSRRLGRSIGIDILPSKTCNYQCIYCQLGKTTHFTNSRQNFFPKDDIIGEMDYFIKLNEHKTDYITFVGSGEPTLYKDIKDLIISVKKISEKPTCVITNGSLLHDEEVQQALMLVDVVLPTLDAGDEKLFIKINRPHPSIKFERMIQGYIDFRKKFRGKFWIEIMLMKGINDSKIELLKIKEKLDLIKPDRIDINVPIRPPTESWVQIPDKSVIPILDDVFRKYNNINYPERGNFNVLSSNFEIELKNLIERHPMKQEQIIETFCSQTFNEQDILIQLDILASKNKIKKVIYNDQTFWKFKN
jgi:wyosine [tRNA(Phe)-imidazoG37] synthetase (radical SAM superfamily)